MNFLKIFRDGVYIKNEVILKEYINFCITNNDKDIEGENHHILPQSIFPEYKDFRIYKDNKTRLSYSNHLKAHYLLILAIENDEMFYAFNMMNNFYNQNNIAKLDEYDKLKSNFKNILKNSNWTKSSKDKRWIYKDGEYKFIKDGLENHLKNGWVYKGNTSDTVWVNNGVISKRLNKKDITEGWLIGRLETKSKGLQCWMNKNNKNKRVYKEEVEDYLKDDWKLGHYGPTTKNKKRISKNGVNKTISENDLEDYLKDGWKIGAYKVKCNFCKKEVSSLGKQNHKCRGKEEKYYFSVI